MEVQSKYGLGGGVGWGGVKFVGRGALRNILETSGIMFSTHIDALGMKFVGTTYL